MPEPHSNVRPTNSATGHAVKNILRIIGWLSLALVLGGLCFFGWLTHHFHESGKTDVWSTDSPPDAAMLAEFAERGYPSAISRVVRYGSSSRWSGDGDDLTIYCFPVAEVPRMKLMFGGDAVWIKGLPSDGGWRFYLREHTPKDLSIDNTSDSGAYIHIQYNSGCHGCTIIDTRRGISYECRFRT